MREISPAYGMSADDFLAVSPTESRLLVERIRVEKAAGMRPKPSSDLIDKSYTLTADIRRSLLDFVAALTDENLFGRSEMCIQFASLLNLALTELGVDSRIAVGTAMYYDGSTEIFRWDHAWVRIGNEAVDGNTDILIENPMVPEAVRASPFWGAVTDIPPDRRLREAHGMLPPTDEDVDKIWWPELKSKIQRFK